MQDTPEGQTRSWATLDDEVLGRLDLEAGWLTSHALLQRCDLAPDSDRLGEALARLHKRGRLQRVHGDLGLLYGPLGIAPPSRTAVTAAPKLPTLHDLNRKAATEHVVKVAAAESTGVCSAPLAAAAPVPASAALATGRNMTAAHAREAVMALIRRAGRVQADQVRQALGVSTPACKYHLQLMQRAGVIERVGTTSSSWYQLATPTEPTLVDGIVAEASTDGRHELPPPAAPASPQGDVGLLASAMLVPPQAAAAEAAPLARGRLLFRIQQGDFALWSDGTLAIRSDHVDVILARPAQEALLGYLGQLGKAP